MDPNEALLHTEAAAPRDVAASLTALASGLSPLDDAAPPALRRYTTAFVDALLASGRPDEARQAAARAVRDGRELAAPPSLGRGALPGAERLDCSSTPHRALITAVLQALARVAEVEPAATPWLFEALKQWASAERRVALELLVRLDVAPKERVVALAEVARFAAALTDADKGRGILRELTAAGRGDGVWALAWLAAVDRTPAASERLLSGLFGGELGDVLTGEPPQWLLSAGADQRRELERLATSAVPAVRVMSLLLLGQHPDVDVRAAALAELAGGGWPAAQLVDLVVARGWVGPDVVAALATARAHPPTGRHQRAREYAANLAAIEQAQSVGTAPVVTVDGPWVVVRLPFCVTSTPFVRGERLLAVYHRLLRAAPGSQWMTDEDEFGILDMSLGTCPEVALHPLPVTLPMTRTGANGARRRFDLATRIGDALICRLLTPFADGSGWGSRNYLFGFTPDPARWDVRTPEPTALPAAARESSLTSISHGELVVWEEDGALRTAADGTPYHLDDWQTDPIVSQAFAARRAAEARLPWTTKVIEPGDLPPSGPWRLCDGRELAGARERLTAAWPEAATGRLHALSGALLADGRVALAIRRFAGGERMRDVLLIAPLGR